MPNYIDHIAQGIGLHCGLDMADAQQARLLRIYALLCLAKGRDTELEDVHDAWAAWCSQVDLNHRSLIPFGELTPEVQDLDRPYHSAILLVADLEEATRLGFGFEGTDHDRFDKP